MQYLPTSLLLSSLALLAPSSINAQYMQFSLKALWQGNNFFDGFNFQAIPDPTNGFVKYVDKLTAQKNGLIFTDSTQAYMGVDYTSKLNSDGSQGGRQSVRISSKASYTMGLFIADFAHAPGGICDVWPAWWTFSPNCEIDIVEGVNSATTNLNSLHISNHCTTAGAGQTGKLLSNNCFQYDPAQSNSGCGVSDTRFGSFGAPFNTAGGGVYAMQWTSKFIRVWFWPRSKISADVKAKKPVPETWGTPASNFQGSCDIPSHFAQHNMIFDTTFCGDYAGNLFGSNATCKGKAPSCNADVAQNPSAFKDAYWLINYVAVFQTQYESNGPLSPLPKSTTTSSRTSTSTTSSKPSTSTTSSATTALSSVVPLLSQQAVPTLSNNAPGATGQDVPGVTAPATNTRVASLDQDPAVQDSTSAGRV